MAELKTVGVKDLKNNLSAYLRDVRRGIRILVSDRSTIVAELHEPGAAYSMAESGGNPLLAEWAQAGTVILPTRPREPLKATGVKLSDGTASRLIDEDRAGREERGD